MNIFMSGRMYEDAEQVFALYERRAGHPLRTDFGLDDIRAEKSATSGAGSVEPRLRPTITFRRLTFSERGHFSNLFTLRPVQSIEIGEDGVALEVWRRKRFYEWSRVEDAVIVETKSRKAYGRYALAPYLRRTLTIRAGGEAYRFDVSDSFPDFHPPREVIQHLERHITVRNERRH